MGKAFAAAAACLLVAACQPMYKDRSEVLKNPRQMKPPKVVDTGEPELPFVDACNVNFNAKPTKQRKTQQAQQLTAAANASLQPAISAPSRPGTAGGIQSVQDAIEKYRQALISDPYNAEATLKLALAYDRVLRKGCALAMLRRLENLASSDALRPEAEPMVDLVVQNPHWFRPYHGDALKAVGK